MNAFEALLEQLRDEAQFVYPQLLESLLHLPTLDLQIPEEKGNDGTLADKAASIPTGDEAGNDAVPSAEASAAGEKGIASRATKVPPGVERIGSPKECLGSGSLNLRLIDQYPCYGILDSGDLTLMVSTGDSNVSHVGTEVRTGSFLEESDFSLITEETIPEQPGLGNSNAVMFRSMSENTSGGFVQDSDPGGDFSHQQNVVEIAETANTTSDSRLHPCAPSGIKTSPIAVPSNQHVRVLPEVFAAPPIETELQPSQIPQEDPLSLGLEARETQYTQMKAEPQICQLNAATTFPVHMELTPKVKTGKATGETTPSPVLNPHDCSQIPVTSQSLASPTELLFPKFFQRLDSYLSSNEHESPSEKTGSAQSPTNLHVATPNLRVNSPSATTGRPLTTPTSLLDAHVPFQFDDSKVTAENRGNVAFHETLPRVTLGHDQILENEMLIRHARSMIGKRPLPSTEHSFVTPAKRIRTEFKAPHTIGIQHTNQNLNTEFTDIRMSSVSVPAPQVLSRVNSPLDIGLTIASNAARQNLQAQPSVSTHMIPNNGFITKNARQMYSINHNNTNVRSEDVDLPKRYHCKACVAVFSFKENCDRHYKVIHLNRQVFQCPHCTSSYLQPKTMRCHIDKKHCVRTDDVSILPCYWCPAMLGTHQEWEFHAAQAHPEQRCKFRGMSP